MAEEQFTSPVPVHQEAARTLWWFRDNFWWESDGLDSSAVALLVWDRERRLESKLTRLQKMRESVIDLEGARRERIPEDVRLFVFERDQGRCQRCGAREQLQFDHIVPVAKGGGIDIKNIELLCALCNQLKSDNVG